ncbi:gamma-glutamylcyclotransferase [Gloeothece verrucosa]|uniref:AIG2 family protein n=1 Tax=Gloeothece verrucosa (strain PCC 7822) TaxID=497965 RepID=E0UGH3_GLOV7|nr:gamma-glutamylcyclotransferase [Gloeothece verrucosa]ADN12068.1 AIG2 family protein [Gloeothece verrucosa PCC 7822]
MSFQFEQQIQTSHSPNHSSHWQPAALPEQSFYYFAYGSCMCPVDLKRTLGENTYPYVIGSATLKDYRLGFYRRSLHRNCGVLDIIPFSNSYVEGVLYNLPWRLSELLDEREEVPRNGYRQEYVDVTSRGKIYQKVRTYVVVDKLPQELAPNDWYFQVVLRGALTCGLSEEYCWQLFNHMYQLQQQQKSYLRQNSLNLTHN